MYSIMATIFLLVYYEIQSNVERERTGIYSHQDALYHQHNSLIYIIYTNALHKCEDNEGSMCSIVPKIFLIGLS